jgi:polysaccharide chain length determinant protein (PEP-CTERM system associated)
MDSFDIQKYLDIALRRKYWIIIPFLLTLLGTMAYVLVAPKVYEAETLILVQAQKVPEEFVRSIVTTGVEDRVRTISQQITSRTNLEGIIKEFGLLREYINRSTIDDMVLVLRKSIRVNVKGGDRTKEPSIFTITFQGNDPETVMKVTNALAFNFIGENLRIREDQALGTSMFLTDELESVQKRLTKKENELKNYREHYMGGLPEQLTTNLKILERLQGQINQLHSSLRDAENRRILLGNQIAEQSKPTPSLAVGPTNQPQQVRDIRSLRNELASLEARYTSKHPDIIRLKEMIASLERKGADGGEDRIDPLLKRQFNDTELEIVSLKDEIKKTRVQIKEYQRKIEDTPKREQELLLLNRNYDNLKALYNSLLTRKLEAEISVSMEKKQKGEQFKVIDPAKVPTRPIKPDTRKVFLLALLFGIGLGCGLAYLVEAGDTSYKMPEDVEKELDLPVLVSLPFS